MAHVCAAVVLVLAAARDKGAGTGGRRVVAGGELDGTLLAVADGAAAMIAPAVV